jgi:hypothetical protein
MAFRAWCSIEPSSPPPTDVRPPNMQMEPTRQTVHRVVYEGTTEGASMGRRD